MLQFRFSDMQICYLPETCSPPYCLGEVTNVAHQANPDYNIFGNEYRTDSQDRVRGMRGAAVVASRGACQMHLAAATARHACFSVVQNAIAKRLPRRSAAPGEGPTLQQGIHRLSERDHREGVCLGVIIGGGVGEWGWGGGEGSDGFRGTAYPQMKHIYMGENGLGGRRGMGPSSKTL